MQFQELIGAKKEAIVQWTLDCNEQINKAIQDDTVQELYNEIVGIQDKQEMVVKLTFLFHSMIPQ